MPNEEVKVCKGCGHYFKVQLPEPACPTCLQKGSEIACYYIGMGGKCEHPERFKWCFGLLICPGKRECEFYKATPQSGAKEEH